MKQFLILDLMILLCISCGSDSLTVTEDTANTLTANSPLVQKLLQVSQYETAIDNVIDRSSCFSIKLPVSVIVNGQQITVNAASDYQILRDIIAESATDVDALTIQYPVTIIYRDGGQLVINSHEGLLNAALDCTGSIELSCLSLNYPVSVKTYNTDTQLPQSFSISGKSGLFNLLSGLAASDLISLQFPILITTPDNLTVAVADNYALAALIDGFTAECLSNIDPTPGPGPAPVLTLEEIITQGTWYVSYFFDSGDETEDYEQYNFTFNAGGSVAVTAGSSQSTGTWDSYIDSGELTLEFTFSSSALEELEEDWEVTDFTTTLIELRHVSGGGGGTDYLTLQKN